MNAEDFAQEEDLMAWQFAQEAAEYWRQVIEKLECADGSFRSPPGDQSPGYTATLARSSF